MSLVDGSMIVELRKQKGMDQKTLAEKAGIHASVLSRLERNLQGDFHISVIVQLADVLDITVDSLLQRPSPKAEHPTDAGWQLVVEQIGKQPVRIQRQAAAIMRGYLSSLVEDEDDHERL